MRIMITADKAVKLANVYADEFLKNEDEACELIKSDSEKYDKKCFACVVALASAYYACKVGLADRAETLRRQKDILRGRL